MHSLIHIRIWEILKKPSNSFEKYAALYPEDANPVDSMAEQYFRMGRLDEAIANYKKALEIKPDFGIGYPYRLHLCTKRRLC